MAAKQLHVSSGVLYTDRRRFYLEPNRYAELYPSETPFISSLMARPARSTTDKQFKLFEHRAAWRYQHLDVNAASPSAWAASGVPGGTVTVAVDGLTGMYASQVDDSFIGLEVEIYDSTLSTYKGHALIVDAPSSTTIQLKSLGKYDSATLTNAALADNDRLFIIDTAFGEGDDAPEAGSDELEVVWGEVQRRKVAVEITKDIAKAALRGHGDELARLRDDRGKLMKIQMERGALLGMSPQVVGGTAHGAGGGSDSSFWNNHITDADGKTVTKSMGVIPAIKRYGRTSGDFQNIFSIDGATYEFGDFVLDTEKLAQYGQTEITAWCGPRAMSFWLSKIIENSGWEVSLTDFKTSALGFKYRELVTPHMVFRLVPMPIFRNTPYKAAMLVAPDDCFVRVVYEEMEYLTNIKTDNAPDIIKDVYQSWEGVGATLLEKCSYWNITGY